MNLEPSSGDRSLDKPDALAPDNVNSSHTRGASSESLEGEDVVEEHFVDTTFYSGEYVTRKGSYNGDLESGRVILDHEEHVLDLTNFDGDNDTALPGEDALSQTVKKQGTVRRAKTRRATKATSAAKERLRERRTNAEGGRSCHGASVSSDSSKSMDPFSPSEPPSSAGINIEHRTSTSIATSPRQQQVGFGRPPSQSLSSQRPPDYRSSDPDVNNWDARSDIGSTRDMMPRIGTGAFGEEVRLEVEEQEMQDIHVVSEHARPGRPKLDHILAEEVENSTGPTIVACEMNSLPSYFPS